MTFLIIVFFFFQNGVQPCVLENLMNVDFIFKGTITSCSAWSIGTLQIQRIHAIYE